MEQRASKRVAARMRVTFSDRNGNKQDATARNISMGGMGVEANFSLPVGSILKISFTLAYGSNFMDMETKVKIVDTLYRGAVQKVFLGLQFVELPKQYEQPLKIYSESRAPI